ncbi:nucleoplasmin-like protein ANO39 [Chenopodium quinoa]|uniref:nucleoplasmin-like protein ANO39 n=1 Tax=Chenopodium quinoa TaxID=63459 RepID=UPI000B77040E|nr:nucleoplasmin-like protein ANO39 [Chenopodium quinoa]
MGDRDVTEVEGNLTKLHSEMDKIIAQEKIKLEELDKMTALHKPGYAVGNEQPDERIIEEDRGGAVAICGADAGNGDEDMEDQNQDGNANDEDEDDEDEDYDDEDDDDYDLEYDENEEDSEDEDDKDEEDAEYEDKDDEHGNEDEGEATEDDDEDDSQSWSTGSDDGGGLKDGSTFKFDLVKKRVSTLHEALMKAEAYIQAMELCDV